VSTLETKLAPQLAGFTRLERLYYRGVHDTYLDMQTLGGHRARSETPTLAIAKICKTLERITDISRSPYLATKFKRNQAGEVIEKTHAEGYGTIIGSEDEPFPRNQLPFGSV